MELVILIGLQGSGKSTFCARQFDTTHLRVSLDVVRTRRREEGIIRAALSVGQRLVVDNTNPTPGDRARYIEWARAANFKAVGYYLSSEIEACLARNDNRPEKQRVPRKGVLATYNRLVLPEREEGFDELYFVSQRDGGFEIQEWKDETD